MSIVDHNPSIATPRISEAEVADYIALLKPRVMSLVIFTAMVGLLIAPVHVHPVLAFTSILCIAVGAGASGALNMWYESDIDAKMSRTVNRPIPRGRVTRPEAAGVRHDAGVLLGDDARHPRQLGRRRPAGLHHLLLRRDLHHRAEALDRAEHRDRRRRRRAAAGGGVGGGDRLAVGRAAAVVPDHLLLDPAAFLGAGAVPQRRLCARRRPDAAGRRRSRCDAAADPALYDRAGAGRFAPWPLGYFDAVYGIASLILGAGMLALAINVYRHREGSRASRATRKLFAFSILYLFALFATLLLEVIVHAIAPSIW